MSELTFREEEIQKLLNIAGNSPDGAHGTSAATAALVHATLEVAEQMKHVSNALRGWPRAQVFEQAAQIADDERKNWSGVVGPTAAMNIARRLREEANLD